MKIKAIRDIQDLRDQGEAWNLLLSRSSSDRVFLAHEWLTTWLEIYGDGKEPCVLFAEEDGHLVGIAPLYITHDKVKCGPKMRQLCFLGDSEIGSDFLDFIIVKGMEDRVLPAMLDYLLENETWDRMLLRDIRADSKTLSLQKALARTRPVCVCSCKAFACPYVNLPSSMDDFLELPDTTYKHSMRRKVRKLRKKPDVELVISAGPDDIPVYLDKLFELHQERWTSVGKEGSFVDEKRKEFYRRVSAALNRRGWLRLSALKVDGEVLAVLYGMLYSDAYCCLQGGCGAKGFKLRAGNALTYELLESLMGKVREFHFLRGKEPYKYQWGGVDRLTVNQCLWRGWKGRLMAWTLGSADSLKTQLKKVRSHLVKK